VTSGAAGGCRTADRESRIPAMKINLSVAASRRASWPAGEGGFTLLEVLVAIVVLSFGVLGAVGLQAAALQANKEARYQSAAVALGRELGDLMRGNKDIAIIAPPTTGNPYLIDYSGTLPTANPSCTPCVSPTEVAQFNMRDWLARVSDVLPGARVVVCFDASPYTGGTDGRPEWDCTNDGGLAVVKIGWTRQSTDNSSTEPERATGAGSRPVVILPLIAGSST
jgi:type IV pilus assembly protein PilV